MPTPEAGPFHTSVVATTGTDPVAIVDNASVAVHGDSNDPLYTDGTPTIGVGGATPVNSGVLSAEVVPNNA